MGGSRLADLTTLILQIQDEGVSLPRQPKLNFIGPGVTAAEDAGNDRINVTIPGGGVAMAYQTIEDEGVAVAQENTMNFVGAGVTATPGTGKTTITIPGGAGGYNTIEDEGTPVAQETVIDFVGAGVTVTPGTGETIVTIPGGGGGGFAWDIDNLVLIDDFFYNDPQNEADFLQATKYELVTTTGTVGTNANFSRNGIVGINTSAVAGQISELSTGFNNASNFSTNIDITAQFVIGLSSTVDVMVFAGLFDDDFSNGTTLAAVENFGEGMYFRYDPASSANWFAVTMSGGTKTETDTSVAAQTSTIIKMEIISTVGTPDVVFKINGSTVATNTTNNPSTTAAIAAVTIIPKAASLKSMDLDFWSVSQART